METTATQRNAGDALLAPEEGLGNTAYIVLLLFKMLFLGVLGFGWYRLLLPSMTAWGMNSAALAAVICAVFAGGLALFATFLARMIGGIRAGAAGSNTGVTRWGLYFIVLFAISALGTLNTLFYLGESRVVFLEAIDQAHDALEKTHSHSKAVLVTPQFSAKEAKVFGLLQSVKEEMVNPRNCGEGRVTRDNIAALKVELPDFKPLSGGTRDCDKSAAVVQSYHAQVEKLLIATAEYQTESVEQSRALLKKIEATVKTRQDALQKAKSTLDISGQADPNPNPSAKPTEQASPAQSNDTSLGKRLEISAAMEDAGTALRTLRADLAAFKGPNSVAALPEVKDLQAIRGLGSLSQILPSLLSRLDRASTYYYVFSAVIMDVILIFLYRSAYLEYAARKRHQTLVNTQKQEEDERVKAKNALDRANLEQTLLEDIAKLKARSQSLASGAGAVGKPPQRLEEEGEGEGNNGDELLDEDQKSDYEELVKSWMSNLGPNDIDHVSTHLQRGDYGNVGAGSGSDNT